jgi:hypothetical protein
MDVHVSQAGCAILLDFLDFHRRRAFVALYLLIRENAIFTYRSNL